MTCNLYPVPLIGGRTQVNQVAPNRYRFFTGFHRLQVHMINAFENNKINAHELPNERWQKAAMAFAEKSESLLWEKSSNRALCFLHSLGLNNETLRKYHIGFNPKDDWQSLEYWGFPPTVNSKGNPSKVRLPHGIVIPCFVENVCLSVQIHRYLTPEQTSKGEQLDYLVKGSVAGLFGAENIQASKPAFLADSASEAMLIDQVARDLVGAASFGRTAKDVGASDWILWRRYLLPVTRLLVPYTSEEEKIITTDSLPFYSHRIVRACLPNVPKVKTLTDLKKVGKDPRDWLIEALSKLKTVEGTTYDEFGMQLANEVSPSERTLEEDMLGESNRITEGNIAGNTMVAHDRSPTVFNEPWLVDPRMMPATPCHCCNNDEYWQRPDGGWVCSTCHPKPTI